MTIGTVQFVVVGFEGDVLESDVFEELLALRTADVIRLIDLLIVERDKDDHIWAVEMSEFSEEKEIQYGGLISGLINLGAEEVTGTPVGEMARDLGVAETDYGLSPAAINDLVHEIPAGFSAVIGLVEHAWSRQLKEATQAAGGVMLAQGLVEPGSLVMVKTELDAALEAAAAIETEAALEATEAVVLSEVIKEVAAKDVVQALVTAKLIEEAAMEEAAAVVIAALAVEEAAIDQVSGSFGTEE